MGDWAAFPRQPQPHSLSWPGPTPDTLKNRSRQEAIEPSRDPGSPGFRKEAFLLIEVVTLVPDSAPLSHPINFPLLSSLTVGSSGRKGKRERTESNDLTPRISLPRKATPHFELPRTPHRGWYPTSSCDGVQGGGVQLV